MGSSLQAYNYRKGWGDISLPSSIVTYQTEDSQDWQTINILNPEVNYTGNHYDQVKYIPGGAEEMRTHGT